jgi:hypothetical protein
MVSSRAASRVLDDALRSSGHSPETIDSEQMSDMLLGPILRDLESILPREGLKRNLRELVSDLKTQLNGSQHNHPSQGGSSGSPFTFRGEGASFELEEEDESPRVLQDVSERASGNGATLRTEAPLTEERFTKSEVDINTLVVLDDAISKISEIDEADTETTDNQVETQSIGEAEVVPNVDDGESDAVPVETATEGNTSTSEADAASQPIPESLESTVQVAPKSERSGYSEQQLEKAVLHFAQIDHTKLVAAVRFNGEISVSRGTGVDLSTLSRLGLLGLRLLGRSGQLHSYYLAHTQGQLFLFPLENDTIVIVGSPELNLGAVFTGLTLLKEEL